MSDDLGSRRSARERALGLLYEAEVKDQTPAGVVAALPLPPDPYAAALAEGVGAHGEVIDGLLRRFARDWKLERMPSVDRALLRLAVYELLEQPDVPVPVVINEAVELAKRFSTDESGKFVNGMLSRIAEEVRPVGGPGGAPPAS
jgi:N utilization substance protein B